MPRPILKMTIVLSCEDPEKSCRKEHGLPATFPDHLPSELHLFVLFTHPSQAAYTNEVQSYTSAHVHTHAPS